MSCQWSAIGGQFFYFGKVLTLFAKILFCLIDDIKGGSYA